MTCNQRLAVPSLSVFAIFAHDLTLGCRPIYVTHSPRTELAARKILRVCEYIFIYGTLIVPSRFEVVLKVVLEYVLVINNQIEMGHPMF